MQGSGKWSLPGFSADPGSAVLVAGSYTVEAVQTQVAICCRDLLVGKFGWGLVFAGGGEKITGWMQSCELQRRVAGDGDWLARLRGKSRGGWSVGEQ